MRRRTVGKTRSTTKTRGTPILQLLAVSLVGTIAGAIIWRRLSRRFTLPCPTWLAGMLESAWSDRVLGTSATLDRIGLKPGARVLEVGPGPGRLLVPAARRVRPDGYVVGLDIQSGMLERLKTKAVRKGVSNLCAVEGDATQPHFAPNTFDVIYFCTALGEIPDRAAALRESYAALRPGGRLSITEIFPDPHYESQKTVARLALEAGFQPETLYGHWYMYTFNFSK